LENIIAKNLALVPTLYALALLPILIGTFMLTCHPKTSKNAARKHRERVKAAEA